MAVDSSVAIVGYLALFVGVGFVFVFVNLLVGRFLRPHDPHEEKLEIYECGEPTIGSSFVQFDLRFYVVALVFIIFDVEVAFLFPWATVFGKVSNLHNESVAIVQTVDGNAELTPMAAGVYRELGEPVGTGAVSYSETVLRQGRFASDGTLEVAGLEQMVWLAVIAAGIFFVVLLVGFAYEWRTGALDWVRALAKPSEASPADRISLPKGAAQESVLSA